jgi:hypothetical protein
MRSKSPSSPEEARDQLADLIHQMQAHLAEYRPHETFVSADLMRWFVGAATDHLAGKRGLEQALGLARTRGRPQDKDGEGRYFTLALKVYDMRATGLSWSKIADELDYEAKEIRDIYARNEPAVLKYIARSVAAKVANQRKGIKSGQLTAKIER